MRLPRTKATPRQISVARAAPTSRVNSAPRSLSIGLVMATSSELRVQANGEDRHRAPVTAVSGIVHELEVQADVDDAADRRVVIALNNALGAGMRQLPIANQDAEPAGVE